MTLFAWEGIKMRQEPDKDLTDAKIEYFENHFNLLIGNGWLTDKILKSLERRRTIFRLIDVYLMPNTVRCVFIIQSAQCHIILLRILSLFRPLPLNKSNIERLLACFSSWFPFFSKWLLQETLVNLTSVYISDRFRKSVSALASIFSVKTGSVWDLVLSLLSLTGYIFEAVFHLSLVCFLSVGLLLLEYFIEFNGWFGSDILILHDDFSTVSKMSISNGFFEKGSRKPSAIPVAS